MNRLTMKNSDGTYSQPTTTTFEKLFYKVAELEDILEKYGIESANELGRQLKLIEEQKNIIRGLQKAVSNRDGELQSTKKHTSKLQSKNDISKEQLKDLSTQSTIDKLKLINDRDTWKKACELACGSKGIMHCPYCLEKDDDFIFNQQEYGCKECIAPSVDDDEKQSRCWAKFFYQQAQKEMKSV